MVMLFSLLELCIASGTAFVATQAIRVSWALCKIFEYRCVSLQYSRCVGLQCPTVSLLECCKSLALPGWGH